MNMGGLVGFAQNIFTMLSGPLGVAIVGAYLIWSIFESIEERRKGPFVHALVGGAAFFSVAWIMSNVLQGVGAGGP